MAENNEQPIHIDSDDARAGATPHVTRYVLGFGLVLVIIAFAFILYT
jgi:acyl dehydratase